VNIVLYTIELAVC